MPAYFFEHFEANFILKYFFSLNKKTKQPIWLPTFQVYARSILIWWLLPYLTEPPGWRKIPLSLLSSICCSAVSSTHFLALSLWAMVPQVKMQQNIQNTRVPVDMRMWTATVGSLVRFPWLTRGYGPWARHPSRHSFSIPLALIQLRVSRTQRSLNPWVTEGVLQYWNWCRKMAAREMNLLNSLQWFLATKWKLPSSPSIVNASLKSKVWSLEEAAGGRKRTAKLASFSTPVVRPVGMTNEGKMDNVSVSFVPSSRLP